jgi:hypothetical protein
MSIGCNWESAGTCVPGVGSLIQGTAMDANGKTAGEVQWGCTLGLGYSMNVPGTSGPYVLTMNVLTTTGGDSVGFAMVPALPEPNEPIAGETGDLMSMTSAVNRGSFW